jgi:imidazolonepropionase-like amidohydrolase
MRYFSKSCAALLISGSYVFAAPSLAAAQDVFIEDATIVTNTNAGRIDVGDILIRGGKIVNMGNIADAPSGMTVINAKGKWVTPGLFAPFSRIGLVEISGEARTNDISADEAATSVSNLAADSFNPKSPVIGNTRLEGITHMLSAPGTGKSIFGGIGLLANTSGAFDSIETEQAFIYVSLGERGADTAGGSRSAAMNQLRAALDDAGAYPSRFGGPDDGDALSRRDAAALFKAARGQMPLLIDADRAADLLNIIKLKQEYGLDVIIVGAAEGWMVAEELKAADIRVMVDPQENLPGSFDSVGARRDNIIMLDAAGVDYAIMTRSAGLTHNIRVLGQHAGNAVGAGLPWDKAFAAISSTPARWFGSNSGTITRGAAANLVVWDGDPLEVTSGAEHIFINGKPQEMSSRQTALRDRYNPASADTRPHKYR